MSYEQRAWRDPPPPTRLTGTVTPLDPATYHGSLRRLDLGTVVAEVMTTAPHRLDREAGEADRTPPPRIVITIVGDGSIVGSVDDRRFTMRQGDVSISDERHELHYVAERDLRVLRVLVDVDAVPGYLLEGDPMPAGVIRRTTLVNSSLAFVSALFTRSDAADTADDPSLNAYLREALVDLAVAILAEARNDARREHDVAGDLRGRIERYTMEHLTDPELSPAVVARALGISVRYAHQVFSRDDTTLARFIRDRRLDQVAADLREGRSDRSFGELGTRFGFGSRDQLARGFRQRFGRTMGEYRADHAPGQGSRD